MPLETILKKLHSTYIIYLCSNSNLALHSLLVVQLLQTIKLKLLAVTLQTWIFLLLLFYTRFFLQHQQNNLSDELNNPSNASPMMFNLNHSQRTVMNQICYLAFRKRRFQIPQQGTSTMLVLAHFLAI